MELLYPPCRNKIDACNTAPPQSYEKPEMPGCLHLDLSFRRDMETWCNGKPSSVQVYTDTEQPNHTDIAIISHWRDAPNGFIIWFRPRFRLTSCPQPDPSNQSLRCPIKLHYFLLTRHSTGPCPSPILISLVHLLISPHSWRWRWIGTPPHLRNPSGHRQTRIRFVHLPPNPG